MGTQSTGDRETEREREFDRDTEYGGPRDRNIMRLATGSPEMKLW